MTRASRGAALLVLGAAGAALVGWLCWAFAYTIGRTSGGDRAMVVALAGLALAIAAVVLLSPPVRDAEVALARPLLGVQLPPVRDRRSWDSRWHGAAWALWVALVGAVAAVVLLSLVPLGVGLIVGGVQGDGVWRVPLGLVLVPAAFAVQTVFGLLLVRTAPRFLGPTAADRLAYAADREAELAQANALARELHDSVGHALTAVDVQAQAALLHRPAGPVGDALERIRATTERALGELDQLLGDLRGSADESAKSVVTEEDLRRLVAAVPGPVELTVRGDFAALPARVRRTAYRVVQEGLTNAAKHGTGPAQVRVEAGDGAGITVTNAIGEPSPGGGRGLPGLRERLRLVGGSLQAGDQEGQWVLTAVIPQ
ncbi:histidine kinase [Flexivirga sp. ID2601S]|uniref:histidine kinase n=1 Tax=Flexivirga aerilata TaxID=1656889 RepID=A0A849AUG0_9MICO|nr:histidine kinase [Flexivirga aerilata]NNG40342.1 histidine kinase [Flexivirga aerilata]